MIFREQHVNWHVCTYPECLNSKFEMLADPQAACTFVNGSILVYIKLKLSRIVFFRSSYATSARIVVYRPLGTLLVPSSRVQQSEKKYCDIFFRLFGFRKVPGLN